MTYIYILINYIMNYTYILIVSIINTFRTVTIIQGAGPI